MHRTPFTYNDAIAKKKYRYYILVWSITKTDVTMSNTVRARVFILLHALPWPTWSIKMLSATHVLPSHHNIDSRYLIIAITSRIGSPYLQKLPSSFPAIPALTLGGSSLQLRLPPQPLPRPYKKYQTSCKKYKKGNHKKG